jgi:hypothetical protein
MTLLEKLFPPKVEPFHPEEDLPEIEGFWDRENRTKHWEAREDLREVTSESQS